MYTKTHSINLSIIKVGGNRPGTILPGTILPGTILLGTILLLAGRV
jgi:hypothetical protein